MTAGDALTFIQTIASRFPRAGLIGVRTPFHRLNRLSSDFGKDIWIKRDDFGDFALAGSKARKLDLILANVIKKGYTRVVGSGPPTSNSCRALAAACSCLGLECHLFLWGQKPAIQTGNAALSAVLGAHVHWVGNMPWGEKEKIALEFAKATDAYPLSPGGTEPLGVAAMVHAAFEMFSQCEKHALSPSAIIHASATGGISAGLRIGAAIWAQAKGDRPADVYSIAALNDIYAGDMPGTYEHIAADAQSFLQFSACVPLHLDFNYIGGGYTSISASVKAACMRFAASEAIVLDGHYMGRAAAALISIVSDPLVKGPMVFWHSGGTQGLIEQSMTSELWSGA